jgi:hypothetical protein
MSHDNPPPPVGQSPSPPLCPQCRRPMVYFTVIARVTESGAMALFECEACKKVEFRPATWKKACISGLGPAKSDPGRAHRGWERPRGRGSWRNGALGRLRVAPRRPALALAPALCFPHATLNVGIGH